MSKSVISVHNLGKRYRLGTTAVHNTLRDDIAAAVGNLFRAKPKAAQNPTGDFWALRNVSFEVMEGDVIGVIGRNGAGKSTLLKILSQITEPSEGEVRLRGRIASLLEVGTGFHPELSGRENIFLNGAILGMTRSEIRKKFDEIVAFSEVEKFLDTPVKRYSSGMHVRLAFAVAAHLEPEILVVDEVLAVGDATFQAKCISKMSDVAAKCGRTVLFVSHNLSAVQRLCTRGIYLQSGQLQTVGTIDQAIDAYQRALEPGTVEESAPLAHCPLRFLNWEIVGESALDKHSCYTRDPCRIRIQMVANRDFSRVFFGFALWDLQGELMVAGSSYDQEKKHLEVSKGIYQVEISVRLPLKAGLYQMQVSANSAVDGQIEQAWLEPRLHILPRLDTHLPEKWHGLLTEPVHFQLLNS